MNKLIKVEKKKAQWDKRQRAYEDQIYKLQDLVKRQHALIGDLKLEAEYWERQYVELRGPSTTRKPYQLQTHQSSTLLTPLESTETIQESLPEQQIHHTHIEQNEVPEST